MFSIFRRKNGDSRLARLELRLENLQKTADQHASELARVSAKASGPSIYRITFVIFIVGILCASIVKFVTNGIFAIPIGIITVYLYARVSVWHRRYLMSKHSEGYSRARSRIDTIVYDLKTEDFEVRQRLIARFDQQVVVTSPESTPPPSEEGSVGHATEPTPLRRLFERVVTATVPTTESQNQVSLSQADAKTLLSILQSQLADEQPSQISDENVESDSLTEPQ